MFNGSLLRAKIAEKGMTIVFVARQLGVSETAFRLKLNGKNEFKASEIVALRNLLGLSDKDVRVIFLP